MINVRCRRCGSTDIRKNGKTASGQQKMHCKECNFYSTLDIQQDQQDEQRRQVERLSISRASTTESPPDASARACLAAQSAAHSSSFAPCRPATTAPADPTG